MIINVYSVNPTMLILSPWRPWYPHPRFQAHIGYGPATSSNSRPTLGDSISIQPSVSWGFLEIQNLGQGVVWLLSRPWTHDIWSMMSMWSTIETWSWKNSTKPKNWMMLSGLRKWSKASYGRLQTGSNWIRMLSEFEIIKERQNRRGNQS